MIPFSFYSCKIPSPEHRLGLVTFFLWIKYDKWDGVSLLRLSYKKTLASVFPTFCCLLSCLLILLEGGCHSLDYPMGKPRGKELRESPAISQWGTEAFSPTAHKELDLVDNHLSELGSGSSFSLTLRWLQLWHLPWLQSCGGPDPENLVKQCPNSWPKETVK